MLGLSGIPAFAFCDAKSLLSPPFLSVNAFVFYDRLLDQGCIPHLCRRGG
jgi:hypothetical protein